MRPSRWVEAVPLAKDERRLELMPLGEVKVAKRNPKAHVDVGPSIARFGFIEPMVLDERTGRLVVGHGRLEAMKALKELNTKPPDGVKASGGDWLIPVLRGWASRDDAEAEAYLLASNQLTIAGGWDEDGVKAMLADLSGSLDVAGLGWSEKELEVLVAPIHQEEEAPIPEPAKKPWVKTGDLFALGKHRLICGDSTKAEDVKRLMGKERAILMNTDPPYGVSYDNAERPNPGVAKPRVAKPRVANDDLKAEELPKFLESVFVAARDHALTENAAWYIWHGLLIAIATATATATAGVIQHRQIIWVKPGLLLGRGQYHWRHEQCFFGWIKGKQPPDYGERNQTTVWEMSPISASERKELNHSTPKPVELFALPLKKHTRKGENCYEPFSGSGSQLIAAEQLGRRCFAMELEPAFVQVAIERWEKFTSKKAKKL